MENKGMNQTKIIEYFKAKNIPVENLDEDYMLVDNKYKVNKATCDWTELSNSINEE